MTNLDEVYEKHRRIIKNYNISKYKILTDMKYIINMNRSNMNYINVNISNIRYFSGDKYKQELQNIISESIKDMSDLLYVKYNLKIKEVGITFDKDSYDE